MMQKRFLLLPHASIIPCAMASTGKPSLSDRLKSLGVKVGATHLPAPRADSNYHIASVVSGSLFPTPFGETFIHEERFAADYHHGSATIQWQAPLNIMADWARDPRLRELPIEAFAFLDTETSGLAGGTGTYAFLIGAGKFVNGEFVLQQFFMRDPSEESAVLEGLGNFLDSCKALVTFNGKAFDAPLLVTRYTLHDIPIPFKDFAHLDLLPLARRLWRDRLESRALKYLEENILNAPRSLEEVPGYEIPYLYFDYLRDGDARPLKGVFYHNAMDVVAMAALLSHTAQMLEDPFHEGIEHGLDVIALAKLYEDLGQWDTAARLFERGLEKDISEGNFNETVRRLSVLQKRRGDFDEAIRLWEEAADKGHIYAFVELAKYYEHKKRDAKSALKWTKAAQKQIEKLDLPIYMRKHWMDELTHRRERLESKLGK
jgi:uncharacterized protein YprB with RNaseH-like and TPR domain